MPSVLVIAPHPDDEVLGCGGTIARLVDDGHEVTAAIVTRGTPIYPASQVRQVRTEARRAQKELGIAKLLFMDLPVTTLYSMPRHKLNRAFDQLLAKTRPEWVFLPFPGDRHEDHRQTFDAAMVALRPHGRGPRVVRIDCYETVSETHWSAASVEPSFQPNVYVDISRTLARKLAAMRRYASQLSEKTPARSLTAIEALARFRGSVVGMPAAEAFMCIREQWPA